MFLSKCSLSFKDIRELGIRDTYSIHKYVYTMFPKEEGSTRSFLFEDKGMEEDKHIIYILSKSLPLYPEHGKVETKEVPKDFLTYQRYRFQVTLNPVKQTHNREIPITNDSELLEWFKSKGLSSGFDVTSNSYHIDNKSVITFKKKGDLCTFNKVTFSGELRVIDTNKFEESFEKGIGRAKGFGFGLLKITPIR